MAVRVYWSHFGRKFTTGVICAILPSSLLHNSRRSRVTDRCALETCAVSITKRMCSACAARVACDTVMIIEHVCKFASVLRPRLVRRLREGMEGAGCSSASRCYLQTLLSCPIPLTFIFFIQNVGVSYIRGTCYRGCLLLARQAPSELFTRQMKTRDLAPPN